MKKYYILLFLLMSSLGIKAQWSTNTDNYHDSYVIYATLNSNLDYDQSTYRIGAFIGDECRGIARFTEDATTGYSYFPIRVWGDREQDTGKEITFKVYVNETKTAYPLVSEKELTWLAEGTTGELSDLFPLYLNAAVEMELPKVIKMKVGDTVNLRELLTVYPEGASLPEGKLPWVIGEQAQDAAPTEASIDDNDVLTALEVTGGITIKLMEPSGSGEVITFTTLIITNPATSMAIKDEYKDGVTVFKNDAEELTRIINDCLLIEPENYSDELKWVIGDQTIIKTGESEGSAAMMYIPIAGGETTMTARIMDEEGNVRLSAVLNVTVVVPVEGIELEYPVDAVFANVGDDIGPRVTPIVKVLPDDATNKEVTWSSDDSRVVSVEGTTMTALKSGGTTLVVTSVDNPDVLYEIPVQVFNPARTVTVKSQEINVEYISGVLDISDLVRENFEIGPEGYESIESGFINSTDTNTVNTEGSMLSDNGIFVDAKVKRPGTSYITVNLNYTDYNGQRADFRPEYPNAIASGEFTINVIQGLEGFTIQIDEAKRGETSAITVIPIPEDAEIDADKVTVTVTPSGSLPRGWTFADVTSQGDGKTFRITPALPGKALVTVSYDGEPLAEEEMEVMMPFPFTTGWQWISLPYTTVGTEFITDVFGGESLTEIRSQDKLLYYDSQYGPFGTLYESGLNKSECYKVKMAEEFTATLSDCEVNLDGGSVSLRQGWNWIANPYFYDRRLSDVLTGNFSNGDRIVSKNDGFAEYSGGRWTGTLSLLRGGEGYLLFTNGTGSFNYVAESGLPQQNATAGAKRSTWTYDDSEFDGNLSMVAKIAGVENLQDYTVGAYVGDECRGEGTFVDGLLFITVHGNAGELVNFIARNEATGDAFRIAESIALQQNVGSVENPFLLNINSGATGIDNLRAEFLKGAKSWNLRGVEMPVNTPQKGVRIVRMPDGKTVKTTK